MTVLRIAISPCPNDTFTFGHLIEKLIPWNGPELQFDFFDIEALNELGCREHGPDVLKFSYAQWPEIQKNYRLCRFGSALGVGVGPLLIASKGANLKTIEKVLIPGEKTTAHLLFKKFGPKVVTEVQRYDRIMSLLQENSNWAGVIIHESRFTYTSQSLKVLLDLGAEWERHAQGPLPLGGVAIHKRVPEVLASAFAQSLHLSLTKAWQNRQEILPLMRRYAQEMDDEVMGQHVGLYVNLYSLDLGKKGCDSILQLTGHDCGELVGHLND